MSRMSLRRQMFYKNIDILLQSNSLHTVEEEYDGSGKNARPTEPGDDSQSIVPSSNMQNEKQPLGIEQDNRPLLTQPKKFSLDSGINTESGQRLYTEQSSRSPIYTYKPEKMVGSDSAVAGNQSRERLVRPGTPYTEIDESKVGLSKKSEPLKFQFPVVIETVTDRNNNNSNVSNRNKVYKVDSLPFSPITKDGRPAVPPNSPFSDLCEEKCTACSHQDVIRALPMSPAYARTSTPGPANISMTDPLCQTVSDDNMCRICHEGDAEEELVSPCDCAGTMGMLHISCLEQWLGSSKTTKCEICQFQFNVLKKPQSVKWFLKEPSLSRERKLVIRDIIIIISLGLFVLIGSFVCIIFSKKLQREDRDVGASLLIVFPTAGVILYMGFLIFAVYKIQKRFKTWKTDHHVIQISYSNPKADTTNKLFRRFPVPKSKRKQHPVTTAVLNHLDPFLARFSLESYKAAMYNPIVPESSPETVGIEGIELHTNSSSVISLDDDREECVRYYQPPEAGNTSILYNETGRLLQETGV